MERDYPTYPIYTIWLDWPQEGEYCRDGRNRTSAVLMLRKPSATEVAEKCLRLQERMAEENNVHPSEVSVEITKVRFEEWCCQWFGHWTFDIGLTDEEVLDSFQHYVWRIQRHNRAVNSFITRDDGSRLYTDDICLMGAEDRWRWSARSKGTSAVGFGEQTGEPPCRCDGCKKAGVVRIDH